MAQLGEIVEFKAKPEEQGFFEKAALQAMLSPQTITERDAFTAAASMVIERRKWANGDAQKVIRTTLEALAKKL